LGGAGPLVPTSDASDLRPPDASEHNYVDLSHCHNTITGTVQCVVSLIEHNVSAYHGCIYVRTSMI